jgi:hypothetical protein
MQEGQLRNIMTWLSLVEEVVSNNQAGFELYWQSKLRGYSLMAFINSTVSCVENM